MAAHTLKGTTGLLSMTDLHGYANALEAAINDAQPASALVDALERGIAAMCAEIVESIGLEQSTESVAKAVFEEQTTLPSGVAPSCITQLIAGLGCGDGDCDRYVEQCLEELAKTAWEPPLRAAQGLIRNFDYAAASRLFSDLQGDKP